MIEYVSLDDARLVVLLKKDDGAAFAEIYRRYASGLADFAGSRLFGLEDARDIIHDLFVALWERRKTISVTGNLSAYLFAAVRYRVIDQIRKNITREEYAQAVQALSTDGADTTGQTLAAKELEQALADSVSQLSPAVREVYRLSREENLSTQDIALKLSRSEQTVKNQLSTALQHLRKSLPGLSATILLVWIGR
ncbi:MAG: RNA polymerase sigma-70 factor [Puia sp.]|nr:RNA polymerase sigma-70 factor [Puia sp.]